jgi:hypothetical protein
MSDSLSPELSRRLGDARPALERGALTLMHEQINRQQLRALLADPLVGDLTSLDLQANQLGPDTMPVLVQSTKVRSLRVLALSDNPVGDQGFKALAQAPWLPRIEQLLVGHCGATTVGTRTLAAALRGGAIRHLDMGGQEVDVSALLDLPLEVLLLGRSRISAAGVRALIAHGKMRELELDHAVSTGDLVGLSAISPVLRILVLDQTSIGPADVAALAARPAPALEALSLKYCPIGDDGVRARARAPWLPQLRALTLPAPATAIPTEQALEELRRAYGARRGLTL